MLERKVSAKPKITPNPPKPSPKSENDLHRRSGLLDGREAIRKFLGVSDYMLTRFIASGMPVLIDGTRWLAHEDNLEDFFRKYTRVDSRSKADSIPCQAK